MQKMGNRSMKKAFVALIALLLVVIFSSLVFFIFEIKALKSENTKNEYLYTQGKLHMEFLKAVVKKAEHEDFKTLEMQLAPFVLRIRKTAFNFECYVWHNTQNIRLVSKIKR